MRLGYFLPQVGHWPGPQAVADVARRAEELGFDSLWVTERTLVPLEPKTPYPLGELPEAYRTVLDPLELLTFAAAHTSRVGLGMAVLNLPWYSPVLLARRLTTLDVLSNGRLRVGVGQGWSEDEHDVAQSEFATRVERFEEAILALKAIWTMDPVEFQGRHYAIPRSYIGPKPVQRPHPPIYVGAFTPPAVARIARVADGWVAAGFHLRVVGEMFERLRSRAAELERDPAELELIVRANVEIHREPLGEGRLPFNGSPEQVAADIAEARSIGTSELCVDVAFDPEVVSAATFLERMPLVRSLVDRSA